MVNDLLTTYFPDIVDVNFTAEMEEQLDEIARGRAAVAAGDRGVLRPSDACPRCRRRRAGRPPGDERGVRPLRPADGHSLGPARSLSGLLRLSPSAATPARWRAKASPARQRASPAPSAARPWSPSGAAIGPFLACSRYPQCKGTRPLLVKTGARCPQCGGDIVEKRSRRGRVFYGCANYPTCRFATWSRPLATPCPQCGGLLTASGREQGRCLQCSLAG